MDGTGIKVPVNRFILYALDTVFIAITLVLQFLTQIISYGQLSD